MNNVKQKLQQYWKIRWLRRSVISAITLTFILLMIPVIIQYSITHLLVKQGADKAQIEDINLNLFAGTLEIKQLVIITGANKPTQLTRFYTNINMLDLVSSKIVIDELQIAGLDVTVQRLDDGTLAINGLAIPANNETSEETKVEIDGDSKPLAFGINKLSIVDSLILYQETDFEQKNQFLSVSLSNLKSWDEASTAELDVDSVFNQAPFKVKAKLNLFKEVKQFKGHASLSALSFTPYVKFYRDYLDQLQGNISLESDFDISMAESVSATVNNKVNIAGLNVDYKDISQSIKNISWNGQTAFNNKAELTVKGDLQISNSLTTDNKQQYKISSFDQLTLKDLQTNIESISFDQLKIENIQLLNKSKEEHFVKLDEINIQQASFLPNTPQLNIKQVGLDNPDIMVEITKQKQVAQLLPLLNTIDNLQPVQQPTAEKKVEQEKPAEPMMIEIEQLQLTNPGVLNFSDLSVTPIHKTQITLNRLDINNISSLNTAQFTIALKKEEYTTIDIEGSGLLFDPTKNMQFTAQIKQLDLPPVTPYSSYAMGYGMKSGVIDTDIKLKLENREIDSEVDLKIDSLEVVETDMNKAEQVSSASGMSIDLAISSLKDSDNVINLKLPIKGNIDEPDFDLSLIINMAMGKAMKSATLSYLKHTLQPFGSLITLFSLAEKAANHISLPPLLFESNSLTFKKDQQELLDKVINVLTERPGLKIKACGISALEDQDAIKKMLLEEEITRLIAINKTTQQLAEKKSGKKSEVKVVKAEEIVLDEELIQQKMRDLADGRAAKVKAFFLEQGKLESNRILNCLSASNLEEKSVASVELLI